MQQFYPQGQKTILFLIIITLAVSIVGIHKSEPCIALGMVCSW